MADEGPASAANACPQCGQANRVAARFCRSCGAGLPLPDPVEAPASLHAVQSIDAAPAPAIDATPAESLPAVPEPPRLTYPPPSPVVEERPLTLGSAHGGGGFGPPPAAHPDEPPLVLSGPPRRRGLSVAAWFAIVTAVAAFVVLVIAAVVLVEIGLPRFGGNGTSGASGQASGAAPTTPGHAGVMVSWDAAKDGAAKTWSIDGYTIALTQERGAGGTSPVVRVTAPDGRAATLSGDPTPLGAQLSFGLGRIDPQGEGEQLLVSDLAGALHHLRVLELTPSGWQVVEIGSFQSDPAASFPKDVDGDGVLDIVAADQRFAGAFADAAAARLPPRIANVVSGVAADVSAQPRFAALFRRDLKPTEAACAKHANGACAAMVADAARLGLRDWAWRVLLADYDSAVVHTWPTLCHAAAAPGQCPPDQQQSYSTMPEALAAFLVAAGYVDPAAPPPTDAATTAPAFDCAGADQPVTILICNTPQLSLDDRTMADTYAAAQTTTADPDGLRNDQKQWLDRRAKMTPDIGALHAFYQARIQALAAEGE